MIITYSYQLPCIRYPAAGGLITSTCTSTSIMLTHAGPPKLPILDTLHHIMQYNENAQYTVPKSSPVVLSTVLHNSCCTVTSVMTVGCIIMKSCMICDIHIVSSCLLQVQLSRIIGLNHVTQQRVGIYLMHVVFVYSHYSSNMIQFHFSYSFDNGNR